VDNEIRDALARDRLIDITVIGRRTGRPRRTEMWFQNLDGQIYLTGTPGRRDWYANLLTNPSFIFHLKESLVADLSARATPVTEPERRRALLSRMLMTLGRQQGDLEAWVAGSPLVSVTFDNH
jgi:hypothetical protein